MCHQSGQETAELSTEVTEAYLSLFPRLSIFAAGPEARVVCRVASNTPQTRDSRSQSLPSKRNEISSPLNAAFRGNMNLAENATMPAPEPEEGYAERTSPQFFLFVHSRQICRNGSVAEGLRA